MLSLRRRRYSKEAGGCLYVMYAGDSPYLDGAQLVQRSNTQLPPSNGGVDPGPIGCVGVKRLSGLENACELKRLWIRKPFRRHRLASVMVRAAISAAANRYAPLWSRTVD